MDTVAPTDAASPPTAGPTIEQLAAQRLADARQGEGRLFFTDESLAVLLRLSANAKTASDALVLLQELQVHQLELEMQIDELRCAAAPAG